MGQFGSNGSPLVRTVTTLRRHTIAAATIQCRRSEATMEAGRRLRLAACTPCTGACTFTPYASMVGSAIGKPRCKHRSPHVLALKGFLSGGTSVAALNPSRSAQSTSSHMEASKMRRRFRFIRCGVFAATNRRQQGSSRRGSPRPSGVDGIPLALLRSTEEMRDEHAKQCRRSRENTKLRRTDSPAKVARTQRQRQTDPRLPNPVRRLARRHSYDPDAAHRRARG